MVRAVCSVSVGGEVLQLLDLRVSDNDRHRVDEFCRFYEEQKNRFLLAGIAKCEETSLDPLTWKNGGKALLADIQPFVNRQLLVEFAQELENLLQTYISDIFHNVVSKSGLGSQTGEGLQSLVEQTCRGNGSYLSILSRESGIPLDGLAFFAVYLTRPVRQSVAPADRAFVNAWPFGYCPVCGLWPRMARIKGEENRHHLWCIGCETMWAFPRLRCPFCLEDDQSKLGYLKIADTERYRIYTCDSCHRYLKTVIDQGATEISDREFDAQYLLTSSLDVTAVFEKYIQDFVGFAAFDLQDNSAAKRYREKAMIQA